MSHEPDIPDDLGERVFQQAMELWITPALAKRQATGELKEGQRIVAVQVIFFPDGRPVLVRVNDEVRGELVVPGGSFTPGQLVREDEVGEISEVRLLEEDRDCGHMTIFLLRGLQTLFFDFRYNQGLSQAHADRAKQFHATARLALDAGHIAAFIENLFSAGELAIRALLLEASGPKSLGKKHSTLHSRFNQLARSGGVQPDHRDTFNTLGSLRYNARYVEGDVVLSDDEARHMLDKVTELIARVDRRRS